MILSLLEVTNPKCKAEWYKFCFQNSIILELKHERELGEPFQLTTTTILMQNYWFFWRKSRYSVHQCTLLDDIDSTPSWAKTFGQKINNLLNVDLNLEEEDL